MTICTKCGSFTSTQVTSATYQGKEIIKNRGEICQDCYEKMISKLRGECLYKPDMSRNTEGCRLVIRKIKRKGEWANDL